MHKANWDERDERVFVNPLYFLGLNPEQDKQIRLAWSGYYDDGDPANRKPSRFDLPMPNFDE